MSRTLALFYCLSKKYEEIFTLSLANQLEKTAERIDELYIICDTEINKEQLRGRIEFDGNMHIIDDDEAWNICGYRGTKYEKLRLDNRMRQQLIKINCDKITKRDSVLVVDVDSFPLTKTSYFVGDRFKLFYAHEKYASFDELARIYFGDIDASYDFIIEKTIFDSRILEGLREFLGDSVLEYSYKRHTWYDITEDEYNRLAGPSWPQPMLPWDSLPEFVKDEIMSMVEPRLLPTAWDEAWSEYHVYGYYAMLHHPGRVILTPCKIQNGPWGDGSADIFLNRPSERNSIDAFKHICYINNVRTE